MKNISKSVSTLNKKHSSIFYDLVCHNVAAGLVKIGWILTADNIAGALTSRLKEANSKNLFGDWNY